MATSKEVFISYSRQDEKLCDDVYNLIQDRL